MNDNNNSDNSTSKKIVEKLNHRKAVKLLSNNNSKFLLTQELLQQIQATHLVMNPEKKVPVTQLITELKDLIKDMYSDEPDTMTVLIDSIPSEQTVRSWLKQPGWNESMWSFVKTDQLFSSGKRASVINSLYKRSIEGDDVAAKIWLTLSGDYSDKLDVSGKDKALDAFREINEVLHRKKYEDDRS